LPQVPNEMLSPLDRTGWRRKRLRWFSAIVEALELWPRLVRDLYFQHSLQFLGSWISLTRPRGFVIGYCCFLCGLLPRRVLIEAPSQIDGGRCRGRFVFSLRLIFARSTGKHIGSR